MILRAFTDGASRGNPGESGIGAIVRDEGGTVILTFHKYIGRTTNNIAEYKALLTLLERMQTISCSRLIVHSDSELMVKQLRGEYRVKDRGIKRQYNQVLKLRTALPFEVVFQHVTREQNREADRLANLGIEARKPSGRVQKRKSV